MSLTSQQRVQKVFELIRIKGSKQYQDYVPALTDKDPIGTVGSVVLSQPLIFKEFTSLLGAFIQMRVWKEAWNNPLSAMINKAGTPLGEYSVDVATNPVAPRQYDPSHPERVLDYAITSDFTAYYARNVKEFFKLSIPYQDMQGAFQSYEKFDEYIQMKLSAMQTGYELSSYNHIMEAIVTNYNAGLFTQAKTLIPSKSIPTGEEAGRPEKRYPYNEFAIEIKTAIKDMLYPSSDYNNYGSLEGAVGEFRGYSKLEDLYIIAENKFLSEFDVNFLAGLFNISKGELEQRIISVPSFSYEYYEYDPNGNPTERKVVKSPIRVMLVDQRAFNFKHDLELDSSFFNDETLVTNYFKHFWATYAVSPFANCLVFIDKLESDQGLVNNILVDDYGQADGERFVDIKKISEKQTVKFKTIPEVDAPLGACTVKVTDIVENFNEPIDVGELNKNLSTYITVPVTDSDEKPLEYTFIGVKDAGDDSATVILQFTFTDIKLEEGNLTNTISIIAELYK